MTGHFNPRTSGGLIIEVFECHPSLVKLAIGLCKWSLNNVEKFSLFERLLVAFPVPFMLPQPSLWVSVETECKIKITAVVLGCLITYNIFILDLIVKKKLKLPPTLVHLMAKIVFVMDSYKINTCKSEMGYMFV